MKFQSQTIIAAGWKNKHGMSNFSEGNEDWVTPGYDQGRFLAL